MAHLNPFFVDDKETDQKVLMFDCKSRKQTTKFVPVDTDKTQEEPITVFQGGRDKLTKQGIGPKVLLTDKANRLQLVGSEIVLVEPELVSELITADCLNF